mmetsp:Transcript_25543/g.40175  ORF Transcript_25543/g.40175 Transcript_25543/m.40175 type:complete len:103 (-) Transcript_25543:2554-2862(-)
MVMYLPVINSIQKHRHRLPHEAKRYPENDISNGATRKSPIDHFSQKYQRYLSHHREEAVNAYHVTRDAYQDFVHNGRDEEDDEGCTGLGEADSDGGEVDVTD